MLVNPPIPKLNILNKIKNIDSFPNHTEKESIDQNLKNGCKTKDYGSQTTLGSQYP